MVFTERDGFYSWPFFSSILLHGLMGYCLINWPFARTPDSVSRIVMVQIVEEKKENALIPPTPIQPKSKKTKEIPRPNPDPQPLDIPKKEDPPTAPIFQTVEQEIPPLLPVAEKKIKIDENPKTEVMEKVEPSLAGNPGVSQEADPPLLTKEESALPLAEDSGSSPRGVPAGHAPLNLWAKEGPGMSLTAVCGSDPKGIPGGLAATNLLGTGAGGEAGGPGGAYGGKEAALPKGAETASVYFQGAGKEDLRSYLGQARMKIEKAKRYPREARRRGWEGKVVLSFQINRKGEVANVRLIQSSGYDTLDEEALAMLRRVSPFSPPPLTDDDKLEVEIPLLFRLEEKK